MINFISNLPQTLRTGGFSARNAAAATALSKIYTLHYIGPINPPAILWRKALSKFLRLAGSQGDFSFFSERRLETIAHEVRAQCRAEARLDFFHGFTPWILTKPQRPYAAWSDCTFRDYINIFHRRDQFRDKDLERIEQAEAHWLNNACCVIFRSDFGAERAITHYTMDPNRVRSVGSFGEIEAPARDLYAGGREFAFVSTDFEAKGGPIALTAFREVRKSHPDVSLIVIGDQPPRAAVEPGVEFIGYLRKEVPDEVEQFRHILGRIRALVHPTKRDTNPAIIVEAGYFGCPVISSRTFAIPELVDDGRTGLLIDDPSQVTAVTAAMHWMLEHEDEYQSMRQAAWAKAHRQHSKQRFEEQLLSHICEIIPGR